MKTCAICARHVGDSDIVMSEDGYAECSACRTETPRATVGPERTYDAVDAGAPSLREMRKLRAEGRMVTAYSRKGHSPGRGVGRTKGFELVRVKVCKEGQTVDHEEARGEFADKPYRDTDRYIGTARGFHVYEYDPREVAP